MENGQDKGRKPSVKGFLAWVNGDEEIDYEEDTLNLDDEDIDEEHHDADLEDIVEEDAEKMDKLASAIDQATLVDYEGDDEFDYPDEIVVIEDLESDSEVEIDYADSVPAYQQEVHMTKKEKGRMKRFRAFYLVLSGIVAINVIAVLLFTVNHLPPFGNENNPAVNEVYTRYVEDGVDETGALNIVSAVLYSYRSFDTLGEAFVLFTAAMGVIMLLRENKEPEKEGSIKKQ